MCMSSQKVMRKSAPTYKHTHKHTRAYTHTYACTHRQWTLTRRRFSPFLIPRQKRPAVVQLYSLAPTNSEEENDQFLSWEKTSSRNNEVSLEHHLFIPSLPFTSKVQVRFQVFLSFGLFLAKDSSFLAPSSLPNFYHICALQLHHQNGVGKIRKEILMIQGSKPSFQKIINSHWSLCGGTQFSIFFPFACRCEVSSTLMFLSLIRREKEWFDWL